MNLWAKGKVLVAAVLLSVLYTSCEEEDNTIGIPSENNLNLNYFEYNIPVEMLWVDSVVSQNLGFIYTGKFDLQEGGIVKTVPYLSFNASRYDTNLNVPHNAIFRDIYLELEYTTAISDNNAIPFSLEVFQLADTIRGDRTLYIEEESALGQLVGQKDFTFYYDSLLGKLNTDSIEYSETIDLEHSLGQYYLNRLRSKDSTTFYDYNAFESSFKGLALVPSEASTAILGFSPSSTRMVIEYTYIDDEGESQVGEFTFAPAKYFHNVTPNKNSPNSNSTFSDINCCYSPYIPSGEYIYQLFGTGINISLDLTALKTFASDSLNNIIISSASLELANVEPTSPDQDPPASVSFYFIDAEGKRLKGEYGGLEFDATLPENEIYQDPIRVGFPLRASYNDSSEFYRANVTLYMQKLIEDESTPAKLLLENGELQTLSGANTGPAHLRRNSRVMTGIKVPKESIKLKIYYSTVE